MNITASEVLDGFEQFLEGAPEAVETGDAEAIAGAGMVDQRAQSRALELPPGDHVNEDANRTGLPQPVFLAGDVLVGGRHAGITEDAAVAGRPGRLFNVRFRGSLEMLFLLPFKTLRLSLYSSP